MRCLWTFLFLAAVAGLPLSAVRGADPEANDLAKLRAIVDKQTKLLTELESALEDARAAIADQSKRLDEVKKQQDEVKDLRKQVEALRKQHDDQALAAAVAEKFQKKADDLQAALDAARTDLAKKDKQLADLRDAMIQAQIQAKSLAARNQEMEDQLRDLSKALEREKAKKGDAATEPPPADIQGLVKEVKDDLMTITVGADAGVVKGQTLEVFRLKPDPIYLGQIRIIDVSPTQAVGKLVKTPNGKTVQPGDSVSSRIK
jgi:predicted  nucleic acid-binding Zn-ribbon protein